MNCALSIKPRHKAHTVCVFHCSLKKHILFFSGINILCIPAQSRSCAVWGAGLPRHEILRAHQPCHTRVTGSPLVPGGCRDPQQLSDDLINVGQPRGVTLQWQAANCDTDKSPRAAPIINSCYIVNLTGITQRSHSAVRHRVVLLAFFFQLKNSQSLAFTAVKARTMIICVQRESSSQTTK